jgi:fatty-acyl-CoA synthase
LQDTLAGNKKGMGKIINWISPRHLIHLAFRLWPGREFLVFRDERLTRRSVLAQVKALACGLNALGVTQGDRVAIFLPACPQAVYAQFINSYLGTVHMPLNPLLGEHELRQILRHSQAKVILTCLNWFGLKQVEVLERIKPDLPDLQTIVVIDPDEENTAIFHKGRGILAYSTLLAMGLPCPRIKVRLTDPALLSYTSGTTGQPKGVLHSYARNWGISAGSIRQRIKREALQCLLLPYPPYHFAGMFGITSALLSGGKVILMDRIVPSQVLATIQKEKVTQIGAPPTIFKLLLAALQHGSFDLTSVKRLTFSSEKLSSQLAQALFEAFHCKLDNFYGTTEAHLISWTDQGDWKSASDTVGKPLPGVEVRVVDLAHQPLPLGELGEFAVRTAQMMNGYFRDPVRTGQVLDDNGWLFTGDSGFIGQDGSLHLTGRVSDIIKRGGELVHPEEVETFLESHPAISSAAVVGLPNGLAGEEILAFIVATPGTRVDLEEVRRFCSGKIAAFKIPSDIRLVPQIPRTPTGKIQRFKLRESIRV